ncbi:MAG: glycoside hydrolase family 5 protein [Deltaproteobacteria bacterium]|nr:MAG: glycoside hydrolase family 5 protein [Deltaproteobacteria bacterium]
MVGVGCVAAVFLVAASCTFSSPPEGSGGAPTDGTTGGSATVASSTDTDAGTGITSAATSEGSVGGSGTGTETGAGTESTVGSGGTTGSGGTAGTGGTTGGLRGGVPLRGVNLAGAEFAPWAIPGFYDIDYTYPTPEETTYFTGKGMNVFRLPFLWERLQPYAGAPLDADELARIRTFVDDATAKGAYVILDPHNYARYYNGVIGQDPQVPITVFTDLWSKLAAEFATEDRVIFGLMNEPHSMPTELWRDDANAAIAAIRAAGATNLVLVPGNAWTGGHSWYDDWYGSPNAEVMGGIVDPEDNFAYEIHQYLDTDASGTNWACESPTIGSIRLAAVTDWMRQQGARAFLAEFGGSDDPTCLAALDDILSFLEANDDVWLGWTYWAAGPWWGDYMYSLEPEDGMDRPQMAPLEKHLPAP